MKESIDYGFMAIGVDIQNDFCTGGSLAVPNGEEVIAPFNAIAEAVRSTGGPVALSRDWHPLQTRHFDTWPVHCVADTHGAEFHRDLVIKNSDIIISKGMKVDEDNYSAFEGFTDDGRTLESIVRTELERVNRLIVVIGGLATDYCVKGTVLDGLEIRKTISPDLLTIVALKSCMRAVNVQHGDEQRALEQMRAAGAVFNIPAWAEL